MSFSESVDFGPGCRSYLFINDSILQLRNIRLIQSIRSVNSDRSKQAPEFVLSCLQTHDGRRDEHADSHQSPSPALGTSYTLRQGPVR